MSEANTSTRFEKCTKQFEALNENEISLFIESQYRAYKKMFFELSRQRAYQEIIKERRKILFLKFNAETLGSLIFNIVCFKALEKVKTEHWFGKEEES